LEGHGIECDKVEGARVERRRAAGEDDYERENRERVVGPLDDLSKQYFPRSVWLTEGSREEVENFVRMSEGLCSEFSTEIEERGYPRVGRSMERRVLTRLTKRFAYEPQGLFGAAPGEGDA
jgi:hypothetical protein